jgi:hypothetical protein
VPKFVADSSVSPQGLKWAVDPVADVVTTAGDLLYATAADTVTRLGIGTASQVLAVNSGATAPEWVTPAAGVSFSGARVYDTGNQTISNNTQTTINFDSEHFDTDGYHDNSVNNTRFTIPSGKDGYYQITINPYFNDTSATGRRRFAVLKNGADFQSFEGVSSSVSFFSYTGNVIMDLVATDYVEFTILQTSGGDMDTPGGSQAIFFQIQYLGA